MNYDPIWSDPGSAWWAKANRAKEHLNELGRELDTFRRSSPYSVTPEPTDMPDRLAYRLRFHHSFPVRFSTIVGDVVSNLRGALECLAFEVARQCNDGKLTDAQERETTFPIRKTPAEFEEFFSKKRTGLYDERARDAFRILQPFKFIEEARAAGVDPETTYEQQWMFDALPRLNHLWNLDKHRRLALMAWWPDLIWWGSDGPSNRRIQRGDGTLTDGSILFYIDGHDEGQGDQISHEFNIVLADDLAFDGGRGETTDVGELLQRWHQFVVTEAFPKIFITVSRPSDLNPVGGHPACREETS